MFIITIAVHYDPPLQYHVDQQQLQQAQSQARAAAAAARTHIPAMHATALTLARTHAQTTHARPRGSHARVRMEGTHNAYEGCARACRSDSVC